MQEPRFFRELARRNPILFYAGVIHVIAGLGMFLGLIFDPRQLLGISVWIKPLKFMVSVTLYVWTVAWFSEYVKGSPKGLKRVTWAIAGTMIVELACVNLQAYRGVTSHYNVSSLFNAVIFNLMGIFILLNTGAVVGLLRLFFKNHPPLPASYALALKLGTFIFIIGSLEGFAMIANNAHTVGQPDGSLGLPWLNWSRVAGDLRISHFLGLHSLQLIPLFGWLVRGSSAGKKLVILFAGVYFAFMIGTLVQALRGIPIVP